MNIKYILTKEVYTSGTDSRVAYGVVAYSDSDEDGTITIVASVHDVTADKRALSNLVLLCNRLELSLIHLYDVIEDFLAS